MAERGPFPEDWFCKRITPEEIAAIENAPPLAPRPAADDIWGVGETATPASPPSASPDAWWYERLKPKMQAGDELWEFSTPTHFWQNLAGRGGVALVRDGKIVDQVITAMN